MATEIAKAYVQIVPSMQGVKGALENELGAACDSAGTSGGKKFASGLGKAISTGAAAIGAAAAAAGAALAKGISSTASYGDEIDKMSQKMGLSAEAYQEWDFVMQHAGTSMESMKASMKTLATAAETNNKAFGTLGITQEQLASMSQEELFGATLEALQNVEDSTQRTYLAGQLLGRGATELGALLNTSAEDVAAMKQQVHDLGGVMSDDAVKASAAYADSLQNLKSSISGITRGAFAEFLPAAVSVMDGLAAVFSGDSSGMAKVKEGIIQFGEQLKDVIPELTSALGDIVSALSETLPVILPPLVTSAVETLVGMIPVLIDAGVRLFTSLVSAMPEIITTITNNLPQIITSVVSALTGSIPQLVMAGVQLFTALITNLPQIIIEIVKAVPEIVRGIVQGFRDNADQIRDVGRQMVSGIWQGIQNAKAAFVANVKSFFSNIISSVKSVLGIASPSKVFRDQIGKQMAAGIGVGFSNEIGAVQREIAGDVDGMIGRISGASVNMNANVNAAGGGFDAASLDRLVAAIGDTAAHIHVYLDSKEIKTGQKRLARAVG